MKVSRGHDIVGTEQNAHCSLSYLEITYYDVKYKKGSVKLCGKNPGFIITNGPRVQLSLHGEKNGKPGMFKLKLSSADTLTNLGVSHLFLIKRCLTIIN